MLENFWIYFANPTALLPPGQTAFVKVGKSGLRYSNGKLDVTLLFVTRIPTIKIRDTELYDIIVQFPCPEDFDTMALLLDHFIYKTPIL